MPLTFRELPDLLPVKATSATETSKKETRASAAVIRLSRKRKLPDDDPRPKMKWISRDNLMKYIQTRRSLCAKKTRDARQRKSELSKFGRLANAWDDVHDLRIGVQVDRSGTDDGANKNSTVKNWQHPNQYTVRGVIRKGFAIVGKSSVQRTGMDGSTHQSKLSTSTASIALILQDRKLREKLAGNKTRGLVVARHHDGTPHAVQFGALQHLLVPRARYMHKNPDGSRKLIPWDEYKELHRIAPRSGVLELFAQQIEVAWTEDTLHKRHPVVTNPLYLGAGNASTIASAIDNAIPSLSLEAMKNIADENRFMLLHEVPDNIAYNRRHMAYFAIVKLPPNIFYYPGGCKAHLITRIGSTMFKEEHLTGEVYNLAYVCCNTGYHNKLLQAAWELIDEELNIIDGTNLAVNDRDHQHRISVVANSYSRGFTFLRQQLGENSSNAEQTRKRSDTDWSRNEPM